jgi:hypothetical protein
MKTFDSEPDCLQERLVSLATTCRRVARLGSLAAALLVVGTVTVCYGASPDPLPGPTPQQLQAFVNAHFASQPDYQPGDLITQAATKQLLQKMRQKGWSVDNADEILEQVLPDDDILIQQLQSKKGRVFWEKVQKLPGGIDRLDRLARMPQGQANVRDMIQKIPDGHKWIEAMTTTERGRRLGNRLAKSPTGEDFNEPTGRIYTANVLISRLIGHVTFDHATSSRR